MTKVKIYALTGFQQYPGTVQFPDTLDFHSGTKAQFIQTSDNEQVILEGTNFSYHGDHLTGGTITKMTFADADGDVYAELSGFEFKAKDLPYNMSGNLMAYSLNSTLLAGSDTLKGSNGGDYIFTYGGKDNVYGLDGDDWLFAGTGNDRYTGGKGSDSFMVGPNEGKDVITDFDAVGGGLKQDYLFISYTDYHIHRDGHDTVIEWDSGDLVRLIGVKRSDFGTDDFHMFP